MENKPSYDELVKRIQLLEKQVEQLKDSEVLLKKIIENLPISVFAKDVKNDFRYIIWNNELENVFGNKASDLLGKNDYDLFENKNEADYFRTYDINVTQGKTIVDIPCEELTTNNGVIYVHTRKFPIYNSKGEPEILIGCLEDITARIIAEKALINEKNFLHNIIDTVPSFIFVKDLNGKFSLANKALADAYGTSTEAMIGKSDTDFNLHTSETVKFTSDDKEVILLKKPKYIPEEKITFANGIEHWMTVIKVPLIEPDGTCNYTLGVSTDITERRIIEEELSEMKKHFEIALETTHSSSFDNDFITGKVITSPALYNYIGYQNNEIPRTINELMLLIHPDDAKATMNAISEHSRGEKNMYYAEFRIKAKNGDWMWCNAAGKITEWNKNGDYSRLIGITSIIDEKKKIEEAMNATDEQFRNIIQSSPLGIQTFKIDNNNNLIFEGGNVAANILLKTDHDKLIGLNFEDAFPTQANTNIPSIYRKVAIKGTSWKTEEIYYSNNKISGAFEIYAFQTSQNRMAVFYNNTTHKKIAEIKLKESEELNRQITDNMVDMIAQFDNNSNFMYASPSYLKILGYESHELIGKHGAFNIHPNDVGYSIKEIHRLLDSGNGFMQCRIKTKLGEYLWVETNGQNIFDENGNKKGYILSSRDITYRKTIELELIEREKELQKQNEEYQALNEKYAIQNEELSSSFEQLNQLNKELVKAKDKAEESDRLKSAFLANMSHEIRTPMNAIVGFADLLKETNLPNDKIEKYLQIINTNSHQLLAIINDIIDISKIEAGQVRVVNSSFSLNNLMNNVFSVYKSIAQLKGIEMVLHNSLPEHECSIIADETRLQQVLNNLLSNAIKFTVEGKIEFGYNIKENKVVFFVKDTGIGIEPENYNLVFERFRQVEDHVARKFGGTGLGLSISKALVELMEGFIHVESEIDKGSTFIFDIPYRKYHNEVTPIALDTPVSAIVDLTGKSVLIAEDEEANFFYIKELLTKTNANIYHAWNGRDAVEYFTNNKVDLVIMDIKMPEMDGYEATRQIKKISNKIPIIAQTAYAMADDRSKALDAGCDYYVSKPINKQIFLVLIKMALQKAPN
jgi:PAS domain S-box-containing protein